jgi:crotonobetaine/carnitine-CoA ligase
MPLYHLSSQAYQTVGTIAMEGTMLLVEKFSARRFWDDVRTYRLNVFNCVPPILIVLLKLDPGPARA